MAALTLGYRCCDRMFPLYIKHSEVEGIAAQARQQLLSPTTDPVALSVLRDVDTLKINGIKFDLWIDTEHAVNDERGNPVLGVCEFDPKSSLEAAILSVSPVGVGVSEELVLSTFAHEFGHAIFDAPSWIAAAARGPGLFSDPSELSHKAYRTTTRDAEHLAKPVTSSKSDAITARNTEHDRSIQYAEFRANEFMGSFLVPRQHLYRAVEELASEHEVTIHRSASLDTDLPGTTLRLTADSGHLAIESLQRALAKRFGVHRRFIEVRMNRYGLLSTGY
jgi:hypothetical protein